MSRPEPRPLETRPLDTRPPRQRPDPDADAAVGILRGPPTPPIDIARFSADGDVGPGCYPDGPPMVPAQPPGPAAEVVAGQVSRLGAEPERWWRDPRLVDVVEDDALRAAVAALTGTFAAPLVGSLAEDGVVSGVRWGDPGASRVAGRDPDDPQVVLVNDRYADESPFLISGSLLHQICSPPEDPTTHPREVLLHALLAMAQIQVLDALPELADAGTELARRQHSLVLSLLESRPAGRARVRIVAPDGVGTIPGGAPSMQTPDFWSIPFAPDDDSTPTSGPLRAVLGPWVPAVHDVLLGAFGRPLVDVVDSHVLDAVLPPGLRARAMASLGLLACGPGEPGRRFAPVAVRAAIDDDAGRLAEIHLAARRSAMPSVSIPHSDDDVVRYHRDEVLAQETWVAQVDGAVVGYLALAGSELAHLYVDPDHAGRGVGSRLLDLAVRRRPKGLGLWAFQVNGGARRFYEQRGFRAVRMTPGADEEGEPDVRMVWSPAG